MHDLLDYFVPYTGYAEFARFSVRFWDELLPDWSKAELLGSYLLDDLADHCEREAIERFFIYPWRHIARFGFDPLIGDDVQILLVHQSIQIVIDPLSIAIQLLQALQSRDGLLAHPSQPPLIEACSLESFPVSLL
jgi:hypothetical protein